MSTSRSAAPGRDEARFMHARLRCLEGYLDLPSLHTGMSFDLLQVPHVTSRIVHLGPHVYELWSPNSLQFPFLPGARDLDFKTREPPRDVSQRRYDGHTGKHDCLHAPQYYHSDFAHWPFMRRASQVAPHDPVFPAFEAITAHWHADSGGRSGCFDVQFLDRLSAVSRALDLRIEKARAAMSLDPERWTRRPGQGAAAAIHALKDVRAWDSAVDLGVSAQRDLREKEAWAECWDERYRQCRIYIAGLKEMRLPFANDDFIGAWVNGLKEEIVLRLLLAGVPCFIVHHFTQDAAQTGIFPPGPTFSNFLDGTELATSLSDENPYQQLALREAGRIHALFRMDDGRTMAPYVRDSDETRSSSLYLQSLPRYNQSSISPASLGYVARGERNYPPSLSRLAPGMAAAHGRVPSGQAPQTAATHVSVPAPTPHRTDGTERPVAGSHVAPIKVAGDTDIYAPRGITYRTIDPERVDWIEPPSIEVPRAGRKTTKWELDEWNGVPAWIHRGKANPVEASQRWFDRTLKRTLYLDGWTAPLGLLDVPRFGAPVPRSPFLYLDGDIARPTRGSYWMYQKPEPAPQDQGRKPLKPSAESLPLRSRSIKQEEGGPLQIATAEEDEQGAAPLRSATAKSAEKGKGKGRARNGDPESEDGDGSDFGGRDFPSEAPLRLDTVVVLDGLDPSLSALHFQRLATDALHRALARPLHIINAQRRMWLRFDTSSEGMRAYGALAQLHQGISASFATDVEFLEAARYTRDIWTPLLEQDDFESQDGAAASAPLSTMAQIAPIAAPASSTGAALAEHAPPPSAVAGSPLIVPAPQHDGEASSAGLAPERSEAEVVRAPLADTPTRSGPPAVAVPSIALTRPAPAPGSGAAARAPPREPRAMRSGLSVPSAARPTLSARLTDPGPLPCDLAAEWRVPRPLVNRLSSATPLRDRLSARSGPPPPLVQRLADSAPPLASRLLDRLPQSFFDRLANASEPPVKRVPSPTDDVLGEPPKKRRRGRRSGHRVHEQDALRAQRQAEAEATGDQSLIDLAHTVEMVAEEEVEEGEIEDAIEASLGGEEVAESWAMDVDDEDIAPVAGPSRLF
ncbi:hypothetical protein B0H15DRAFT_953004 [Mycena belliarum]|uniref:Uncharacterized protein n=1 Tax=Mycena belliarum TaxID=1033014 RepID=A0AAD6XR13_9AGAR|nr:hypothetical protein B0H15DRAFT_953004 [Mycena belliae]